MTDTPGASREIEIKLELTEEVYRRILREAGGRKRGAETQENAFFDTQDLRLKRDGWALRLRREAGRHLMTLKGLPRDKESGVYDREEHEAEVPAEKAAALYGGFSAAEVDLPPARKLRELYGAIRLRRRFGFVNRRTYIAFGDWVLELDKTEIADRSFYELEMEVAEADSERAAAELRRWFGQNGWPYRPSASSKLVKAERILADGASVPLA